MNDYEFDPELLDEYIPEMDNESELVEEMMALGSEQELDNFLGNLWKGAVRLYKSPMGQALKGKFISGVKQLGKKMIPGLAKNLGGYLGGAQGAALGSQIGNTITGLFEIENEGEVTDYLRVIRNVARYLNRALESGANTPPPMLVNRAIYVSAQPYFQRRQGYNIPYRVPGNSGKWIRKGNRILVIGAR
jgi:hypothetical protein